MPVKKARKTRERRKIRQRKIALLSSKIDNDDKCRELDAELSLPKPPRASQIG